jgi:hypothetical protein
MKDRQEYKGLWFCVNTPAQVKNAIAHAYENKLRVRLHYGDAVSVWLEENDVMGRIGRSMGPIRVPLLIKSPRAFGGGAILDDRILGVQVTDGGAWLYKSPAYRTPRLDIVASDIDGYAKAVRHWPDEDAPPVIVARFKTAKAAQNYVAFMRGERMRVN